MTQDSHSDEAVALSLLARIVSERALWRDGDSLCDSQYSQLTLTPVEQFLWRRLEDQVQS